MSSTSITVKPRLSKTEEPKSWREVIAIHPAAELLPPMSESELRELGKDIKKNGLLHPIVIVPVKYGDDLVDPTSYQLVDGRNRLDAMELVGIPFELNFRERRREKTYDWILEEHGRMLFIDRCWPAVRTEFIDDPYDFVLSVNVHRRHLKPEQKRELIAKVLKAKPERSDRQIAEQIKVSPTTVGSVRAELEKTGMVSKLDTIVGKDGVEQPRAKAKPTDWDETAAAEQAL